MLSHSYNAFLTIFFAPIYVKARKSYLDKITFDKSAVVFKNHIDKKLPTTLTNIQ